MIAAHLKLARLEMDRLLSSFELLFAILTTSTVATSASYKWEAANVSSAESW